MQSKEAMNEHCTAVSLPLECIRGFGLARAAIDRAKL
jgi:hypothetical protein